jgi:hypothetical protein
VTGRGVIQVICVEAKSARCWENNQQLWVDLIQAELFVEVYRCGFHFDHGTLLTYSPWDFNAHHAPCTTPLARILHSPCVAVLQHAKGGAVHVLAPDELA